MDETPLDTILKTFNKLDTIQYVFLDSFGELFKIKFTGTFGELNDFINEANESLYCKYITNTHKTNYKETLLNYINNNEIIYTVDVDPKAILPSFKLIEKLYINPAWKKLAKTDNINFFPA